MGNNRTTQTQIACHKIVLVSAIPSLKQVLTSRDEEETLILPDCDFIQLCSVVDAIYESLVTSDLKDPPSLWTEVFGIKEPAKPMSAKKKKPIEKDKTCSECQQVLPFITRAQKRLFQQHLSDHFKCNCDIVFGDKRAFILHLKTVHKPRRPPPTQQSFHCSQCKATLSSEKFLQRHIQSVHNKQEVEEPTSPHSCVHCGRKFLHQRSMLEHTRNFHNQMKCGSCDMVLSGHLSLLKHQRENHVMPAICEHCGRHFKHKKYLRDHVVRFHVPDNERPFPCKLCPRGFLNQLQLDDHVARLHEGRRPYTCRFEGCARSFTLPGTRKRHEKRDHNLCINLKRGMRSKSEIHTILMPPLDPALVKAELLPEPPHEDRPDSIVNLEQLVDLESSQQQHPIDNFFLEIFIRRSILKIKCSRPISSLPGLQGQQFFADAIIKI